jgi:hypothetical protein
MSAWGEKRDILNVALRRQSIEQAKELADKAQKLLQKRNERWSASRTDRAMW